MSFTDNTQPVSASSAAVSGASENRHHHAHHSSREQKSNVSQGDNRRLRYRHGFGRWDYIIPIVAFTLMFLAFAALYFFL